MSATRAAWIGVIGLAIMVVGAWFDPRAALASWLVAVVAWSALPIGALAVLMVTILVRGRWSEQLGPPLRAVTVTLPLIAVLFVPVLLGLDRVYAWAVHPADVPVPGFKTAYLTPWFFALRTPLYVAIWSLIAWQVRRGARGAASLGLILYAITGSLAGVDWAMSIEPAFHSSIYGLLFLARHFVTGLAIGILLARRADPRPSSLGGAVISTILFWAYVHAMQVIVIWSGDIPEEVTWYLVRTDGAWRIAPWLMALGGGFGPFFILLSSRARASHRVLDRVCIVLIATGFVEAGWLILPPLHLGGAAPWILVPAAVIAVGGLAIAAFGTLRRRAAPAAVSPSR